MSTALSAPWYCALLRRASAWLAEAAHRLEVPAIDGAMPPARDTNGPLERLRERERAEERMQELRTRYY